jgi:hypothetical protein
LQAILPPLLNVFRGKFIQHRLTTQIDTNEKNRLHQLNGRLINHLPRWIENSCAGGKSSVLKAPRPHNFFQLSFMNDQIADFLIELRADRAATKEKEKREVWTKFTSLSIVFIAVMAAVATQWGGKYSSRTLTNLNEATYNQALVTDEWSYFEAKSIKQTVAEGEAGQAVRGGDTKLAETLQAKIKRYDAEKAEITAKAKAYELKRDQARDAAAQSSRKGAEMGLAVSLFQISIAIGSICLVMKKKNLWWLSLACAAIALAQTIYAMML